MRREGGDGDEAEIAQYARTHTQTATPLPRRADRHVNRDCGGILLRWRGLHLKERKWKLLTGKGIRVANVSGLDRIKQEINALFLEYTEHLEQEED